MKEKNIILVLHSATGTDNARRKGQNKLVYFGLDLGDGESCVHWSRDAGTGIVNVIPISGKGSFLSAVAKLDGRIIIGDMVKQTQDEKLQDVNVCFKRHFLENQPETDQIILDFVKGILEEVRKNPSAGPFVDDEEKSCFLVGCPAGWSPEERERYRQLMIKAGMKNVRIVSESRAAFENVLHSRENAIDPNLEGQTMLVIDIGSSTLDFAYVLDGHEYGVTTAGNILLGGGLMDELIVLRSLELQKEHDPENVQIIETMIERYPAKKGKLMLAARELKEYYFEHEEDFLKDNSSLEKRVTLFGDGGAYRVMLQISPMIVEEWIITRPHPLLNGQSFESRLQDSLVSVCDTISRQKKPDLVILTGGPSRMSFFREMCEKQFKGARLICSKKPEYDISRGLVFVGKADEKMTACIREVREYAAGPAVEELVKRSIPSLAEKITRPLLDAVMDQCVAPAFESWKKGRFQTLNDFQRSVENEIKEYLRSDTMQKEIEEPVNTWSSGIIRAVEEDINSISLRHDVPFTIDQKELSIRGYSGGNVRLTIQSINNLQAIAGIVLVITVGLICGGSGIALLATGPVGIVLGAIIAIAAILLGKGKATEAIMNLNIPGPLRRLFRTESILSEENRMKIEKNIREGMLKNPKMAEDLVAQVSQCIDAALSEAAGRVEQYMES